MRWSKFRLLVKFVRSLGRLPKNDMDQDMGVNELHEWLRLDELMTLTQLRMLKTALSDVAERQRSQERRATPR